MDVRCNAQFFGEVQGEPAAHSDALGHHRLGFERGQWTAADYRCQSRAERLQTVAGVHNQHTGLHPLLSFEEIDLSCSDECHQPEHQRISVLPV